MRTPWGEALVFITVAIDRLGRLESLAPPTFLLRGLSLIILLGQSIGHRFVLAALITAVVLL